jgi:hypothetical protein
MLLAFGIFSPVLVCCTKKIWQPCPDQEKKRNTKTNSGGFHENGSLPNDLSNAERVKGEKRGKKVGRE